MTTGQKEVISHRGVVRSFLFGMPGLPVGSGCKWYDGESRERGFQKLAPKKA